MKVRLFITTISYSGLGACLHYVNYSADGAPRDLSVNHEFIHKGVRLPVISPSHNYHPCGS